MKNVIYKINNLATQHAVKQHIVPIYCILNDSS